MEEVTKPGQTVRGRVGAGLIEKADRFFRNNDDEIWIEVLQNARRARATRVEITIEEQPDHSSLVTVHDNGRGIQNFRALLTLGDSHWTSQTKRKEDPAGMGFYSLCHSEVEIYSGNHFLRLTPEVFLGTAEARVENRDEPVVGTRLRFRRPSARSALAASLSRVTEFLSMEVRLEGAILPRHDFLEGALYRETVDGIEVGFGTRFAHPVSYNVNWNFYGARLRHASIEITGLLPAGKTGPQTIQARFQVLDTASVKLQLPDRTGVIEDEAFRQFWKKARAAAYRFFQTQPQHALPFENWQEARTLGIELPEAAYLLTPWHAEASDDQTESPFHEKEESRLLQSLDWVILVRHCLPNAHTLEGSLHCGAKVEGVLYEDDSNFEGYSWYDKLPTIINTRVLADSVPYAEWRKQEHPRPSQLQIEVTIRQNDAPNRNLTLPIFVHVETERYLEFVAISGSPWDKPDLNPPFPIFDFLMWATFAPSDEGDTWDTQEEHHRQELDRQISQYFHGRQARLLTVLRQALPWDLHQLAEELGITEICLTRTAHSWHIQTAGHAPA